MFITLSFRKELKCAPGDGSKGQGECFARILGLCPYQALLEDIPGLSSMLLKQTKTNRGQRASTGLGALTLQCDCLTLVQSLAPHFSIYSLMKIRISYWWRISKVKESIAGLILMGPAGVIPTELMKGKGFSLCTEPPACFVKNCPKRSLNKNHYSNLCPSIGEGIKKYEDIQWNIILL